jgi:hypothetical protein
MMSEELIWAIALTLGVAVINWILILIQIYVIRAVNRGPRQK